MFYHQSLGWNEYHWYKVTRRDYISTHKYTIYETCLCWWDLFCYTRHCCTRPAHGIIIYKPFLNMAITCAGNYAYGRSKHHHESWCIIHSAKCGKMHFIMSYLVGLPFRLPSYQDRSVNRIWLKGNGLFDGLIQNYAWFLKYQTWSHNGTDKDWIILTSKQWFRHSSCIVSHIHGNPDAKYTVKLTNKRISARTTPKYQSHRQCLEKDS